MELDPSRGPLLPSWEWKVVGAGVVAHQNITNFIAKGYGPRTFGNSIRRHYAKSAARAFTGGNSSRSKGDLLHIIEKGIEGTLPVLEWHAAQLKRQSNDSKNIRDTLREDLEAIAIWIAWMDYHGKLRERDKVEVEWLKPRLREAVSVAARALGLAEQSDTLALSYGELVEDMARWLQRRRKQKAVNGS